MNSAARALYLRVWTKSWSRLVLTLAGVALGAALFVTSIAVPWSVARSVDGYLSLANRSTIEVAATADAGMSVAAADRLADMEGVAAAAPIIRSVMDVRAGDRSATGTLLLGLDRRAAATHDPAKGTDQLQKALGDVFYGPSATATSDGVFVGAALAKELGVRRGGKVLLTGNTGRPVATPVIGVIPASFAAGIAEGRFMLTYLPIAQRLVGRPDRIDSVFVVPAAGTDQSQLLERLQSSVGGEGMAADRGWRREQADAVFAPLRGTMMLMAIVALGVGSFLAYNTVSMVMMERRREFAVLRALGGSPRSIIRNQRQQALLLGLVGSAVGAGVGAVAAGRVIATLPAVVLTAVGVRPTLNLPWWCIPAALIVGTLTTLIGAERPIRSTLRIRPAEAMRSESGEPTPMVEGRMSASRLGLAMIVVAGGVWAAIAGGANVVPASLLLIVGGAVLAVSASTSALSAAARVLLSVAPGRGHIVASSLSRAPRRLAATVSALVAAGTLMVAVTGMTRDMSSSLESMVGSLQNTDLWVQTSRPEDLPVQSTMPTSLRSLVVEASGARGVVTGQLLFAVIDGRRVMVQGVDGRSNTGIFTRATPAAQKAMLAGKGVIVSGQFADHHGLRTGDRYSLPTPTGTHELTVAGVVRILVPADGGEISLNLERVQTWFERPGASWFELDLGGKPAPVAEVTAAIASSPEASDRPIFVTTGADFTAATRGAMAQLMSVFRALAVVVIAVAGMAVANTLMISVHERRRELSMLYTAGGSPRSIRRMVVAEAAALGVLAGVIVALLGGFAQRGAVRSVELVSGFPVDARFTPSVLAVGFVSVVVVSVVGSVLPALHAARASRQVFGAPS